MYLKSPISHNVSNFNANVYMKSNVTKKRENYTAKLQKVLEELKVEIGKGWDAPVSKRSVKDIIKSKKQN